MCLWATAVVATPPSWLPLRVAVARARRAVAVVRAVARVMVVARVRVRAVAREVAVTVAVGGNSDSLGGNTTIN